MTSGQSYLDSIASDKQQTHHTSEQLESEITILNNKLEEVRGLLETKRRQKEAVRALLDRQMEDEEDGDTTEMESTQVQVQRPNPSENKDGNGAKAEVV